MKSGQRILKATAINLTFSLTGKGLNYFALSILVAHFFGATWKTDSYVMGGIIPFWIMTVILFGFNSCFIPVFIYYKNKFGDENARQLAASFGFVSLVGLSLLIILGIGSASLLIPFYSPGLDQAATALAVSMARWIFFSLFFYFLGALLSSIFYSYHRYEVPAIGSILLPLAIIINIVLLNKRIGIYSLVSGLICGQVCQVLWMFSHVRDKTAFFRRKWDFRHPGIKKIFKLFGPIAVSCSVYPLYLIITRMLASTLGEGNIANLDFATKIVLGITMTVTSAIAISILPTLSEIELLEERRTEELNRAISLGVSVLSFVLVPIGFVLIALRIPIVRLLLERGAYLYDDSLVTSQALQFLAITALIEPFNTVLMQVMFALKDTSRILLASISGFVVNLVSAVVLVKSLKIAGLALSVPLGLFVQMLILFYIVKAKVKSLEAKTIFLSYGKVFFSAAVMALIVKIGFSWFEKIIPLNKSQNFLFLSTGLLVLIGGVIYILCLFLMKFKELRTIWQILIGKIRQKRSL